MIIGQRYFASATSMSRPYGSRAKNAAETGGSLDDATHKRAAGRNDALDCGIQVLHLETHMTNAIVGNPGLPGCAGGDAKLVEFKNCSVA